MCTEMRSGRKKLIFFLGKNKPGQWRVGRWGWTSASLLQFYLYIRENIQSKLLISKSKCNIKTLSVAVNLRIYLFIYLLRSLFTVGINDSQS